MTFDDRSYDVILRSFDDETIFSSHYFCLFPKINELQRWVDTQHCDMCSTKSQDRQLHLRIRTVHNLPDGDDVDNTSICLKCGSSTGYYEFNKY